jgi:type III secretion protein L
LVKNVVVEAKAEAQRIRAEAEREAAAIRDAAVASAQDLREAAYREGLEAALLELNMHLLAAGELRDAALVKVEQDVLRLSVKIAQKIIGREIERDDETLAQIVANALNQARRHETLTLRINPADLPHVHARRELLDQITRAPYLDLVADPLVTHGGCIIESDSGTIDAQLETQLRIIERALLARANVAQR